MAGVLHAQGKHAEALELYAKSLAIWRELLGEQHATTADTYNSMAGGPCRPGPVRRGAGAPWQGPGHPARGAGRAPPQRRRHAQQHGPGLWRPEGKHAEALEHYGKNLAISREVLGEKRFATAATYSNMSEHLSAQGKHAEALEHSRRSVAILREVLGERHPIFGDACASLAVAHRAQGDGDGAREWFAAAHAAYSAAYGDEHSKTRDAAEQMRW